MGLLIDKVRSTLGKDLPRESKTQYSFKTGIDVIDYRNGYLVTSDKIKSYYSVGIPEGTYVLFIGRSGSGKTTIALQIAANIVKPYENGAIFHYDIEAATTRERFKQISRWTDDEIDEKYVHFDVGITAESFYSGIKRIYDNKMELKDSLTKDTDKLDTKGNVISILEPTVVILDSLAMLVPKNISDEEELSGSMSATAVAKVNSAIFQRIIPLIKEANIILIVINHINTKININPMMPTKSDINYLKQD